MSLGGASDTSSETRPQAFADSDREPDQARVQHDDQDERSPDAPPPRWLWSKISRQTSLTPHRGTRDRRTGDTPQRHAAHRPPQVNASDQAVRPTAVIAAGAFRLRRSAWGSGVLPDGWATPT